MTTFFQLHGRTGRGFALLLLLVALALFTQRAEAQPVVSEWANKSFAEFRAGAERGDPVAMRMLANAYLTGEGIPQDATLAAQWLSQAAAKRDVLAQHVLGVLYDQGKGVQADMVEAVRYYRMAAEAGLSDAQFNLGVCYVKGLGVKKDLYEANSWFNKAAEQGDAQAQTRLGLAYLTGEGADGNATLASKWLRLAAYQNEALAQYYLARLYQQGLGVPKDSVDAAKWFRKAAELNNPEAQYQLGLAHATGDGVVRDSREATLWLQRAAAQGHAGAQQQLGMNAGSFRSEPTSVPPLPATGSAPANVGPRPEPPPFFSGPGNRDLPPAANTKEDPGTKAGKGDPSFFSPFTSGTNATGSENAGTGQRDLTPTISSPGTMTGTGKEDSAITTPMTGGNPRTDITPPETRRSAAEDHLRQPQPEPSSGLFSPTSLAFMTLSVAVAMLLVIGYLILVFKSRISSLENEIKKTQFELSKANVNLTAMLHQVEALQLGERGSERKQVSASWKELPAEGKSGDTAFRARRRDA